MYDLHQVLHMNTRAPNVVIKRRHQVRTLLKMHNGFFSICGMHAVHILISYQSHKKYWSICLLVFSWLWQQISHKMLFRKLIDWDVLVLFSLDVLGKPNFMTEGASAARQETFHFKLSFLLVIFVVCDVQTNTGNKGNKVYSALVIWWKCSLPLQNFCLNFPEPASIWL